MLSELRAAWGTSVVGILAGQVAVSRNDLVRARRLLTLSDELATAAHVEHLPLMAMWRSDLVDALGAPGPVPEPGGTRTQPETVRATLALAIAGALG